MALLDDLISLKFFDFLEKIGIGAKKSVDLTIPNVTQEELETLLDNLALREKWSNKHVQELNQTKIFSYQIGQWGFKVSGAQRATVTSRLTPERLDLTIESRSTMGQLYDWGRNQKNIDTIKSYLESITVSSECKQQILREAQQSNSIIPQQPKINTKYFLVLLMIPAAAAVIFVIPALIKTNKQLKEINYDAQRHCDLAKIQYTLENYFQEKLDYPNSPESIYFDYFPNEQRLPRDPETSLDYDYERLSTTRYQLKAKLSDGKTKVKDPLIDFPGKNSLLINGDNSSIKYLETITGSSLYELPCSLVQ